MNHTPTPDLPFHVGTASGKAKNHAICSGPIILANVLGSGYPVGEGWSEKSEELAAFIVRACNSHGALIAALKEAAKLAWEVGSETEDGVMTLLEDSRGDLYRQINAALAQAGENR